MSTRWASAYFSVKSEPGIRCWQKTASARGERAKVAGVMTTHALSQWLIGIRRHGFQRAPAEDRNHQLRQRLRKLAEERRRWGCPMLYLMVRRECWRGNHKRVERLYRQERPVTAQTAPAQTFEPSARGVRAVGGGE
jgi:HTH-like domain